MSEGTSRQRPVEDFIGIYFMDIWRHTCRRPAKKPENGSDLEEDGEKIPTELEAVGSSGGFSVVSPDKLSLLYPSVDLHPYDVGVVQANHPAPSNRSIYYFEMFVKSAGEKGLMAIGFTTPSFKLRRQPVLGHHGSDRFLYHGDGNDRLWLTYTTGDTVGAGINFESHEYFFTNNGGVIGIFYKEDFAEPEFPTVAVHSKNEEVTVNFGKKPFAFDIKGYKPKKRMLWHRIGNNSIPRDGLIRSYLQHYGDEDTLKELESTMPPNSLAPENVVNEEDTYALVHRNTLRKLIMAGKIDAAISILENLYPQIVQDDTSTVSLLLRRQKFIELIREAVNYGRKEFKFKNISAAEDLVKDCGALLAYDRLSESSVGYLLGDDQREYVADKVNALILATNPKLKDTKLL